MQTRHRIPSIFNLSMVDVLCCALGCVLLLWLLNLREARDRAEEAIETGRLLSAARHDLELTRLDLELARGELTFLMQATVSLTADLDQARRKAAANHQQFLAADDKARTNAALLTKTQAERDAARATMANLETKLTATQAERDAARATMANLETKLAAAGRRAEDLTGRMSDAEARIKQLQATADLVPGLRDEVKSFRDKFNAEHALALALEKSIKQRTAEATGLRTELDELRALRGSLQMSLLEKDKELARANLSLQAAQDDKKTLLDDKKSLLHEISRVKAAAENRFAGINLTGRRVVFLVDKSGSMGLLDPDTEAKEKWPIVCQTVGQIMKSLPDMEKFQVIVFSTDATYLLGQEGRWLDFDAKTSPDRVVHALTRTEPKGGTNLYAGAEAAFALRGQGLDTIYLISDGIPDRGAGLPPNSANLSPVDRSNHLARHVRTTIKTDWNRELAGRQKVRIHCVGFYYESPDLGAFLWALARENDGSFVGMSKP